MRERRIAATRIGRSLMAPLAAILFVLAAGLTQAAEPDFPRLDGRVIDAAGVLSAGSRAGIAAKLKAHEDKTSDQVVAATVPSLQGLIVEDYANRLFRAWKLGGAKKDNGVLLLVAPRERKVRIEVGYGLEGALTDALSKVIVTTAITPKFKQGDFAGGIEAGVDAILAILSGDAEEWHRRAEVREDAVDPTQVIVFVIILVVLILIIWNTSGGRRRGRGGNVIFVPGPSGGWSGGYSDGGGFSGGGFSGGGGSSGGGGASGDW